MRLLTSGTLAPSHLVFFLDGAMLRFANLVTMEWWDDIWLNEAFASYASDILMAPKILPDFPTWLPFLDQRIETSMRLDAGKSHAIITPIVDEAQMSTAFDTVTYDKGASGKTVMAFLYRADYRFAVLRMISEVVGEEAFLKGVSSYLKKFSYGNSVGQNCRLPETHAMVEADDSLQYGTRSADTRRDLTWPPSPTPG